MLYIQWRRKTFFYGDAHIFPAIVVNCSTILKWEPKTSMAIDHDQHGSKFIVYNPRVI